MPDPFELHLDDVMQSEFSASNGEVVWLRGFTANNIPTTDAIKALPTIISYPGMPQPGDNDMPNYPLAVVDGYRVHGFSDIGVKGAVIYRSPQGAGLQTILGVWHPQRVNNVSEVMTELDAAGFPILVLYSPSGDAIGSDEFYRNGGAQRLASVRKYVINEALTLTAFRDKRFDQSPVRLKVNRDKYFDHGPGYWLCMGVTNQTDNFGKVWICKATFWGREEGWDHFVTFIDPLARIRGALIDPADVAELRRFPITNQQTRKNGITRAFSYYDVNFRSYFQPTALYDTGVPGFGTL